MTEHTINKKARKKKKERRTNVSLELSVGDTHKKKQPKQEKKTNKKKTRPKSKDIVHVITGEIRIVEGNTLLNNWSNVISNGDFQRKLEEGILHSSFRKHHFY